MRRIAALTLGVAVGGFVLVACGSVRPDPQVASSLPTGPASAAAVGERSNPLPREVSSSRPLSSTVSLAAQEPAKPPFGQGEASSEAKTFSKLPLTPLSSGPIPTNLGVSALNTRILSQVSPPVALEDLPLGPGDLIEVSVFEVQELSKLKIRVPLNGRITFPLLGSMGAGGLTPVELEEEIRARLQARFMHDPQVSVFVLEQKSHRVSVIGAVRKGGVLTYTGQLRLADALAMAEGLAEDADHVIYLIRRVPAGTVARAKAGEALPPQAGVLAPESASEEITVAIDLDTLASGKEELNVPLKAGDVIHVPRAGSFYVGGEVTRPGTFPLKVRMTLDQAILAAGGVKNVADWSDVRIYRPGESGKQEVLTFDLSEIEKGKPAPEVQRNDVVLVGKSAAKTFVYGMLDFVKGIFNIGLGVSRGF